MANGPYTFTKLVEHRQGCYLSGEAGIEKDSDVARVLLSEIGIHSCF